MVLVLVVSVASNTTAGCTRSPGGELRQGEEVRPPHADHAGRSRQDLPASLPSSLVRSPRDLISLNTSINLAVPPSASSALPCAAQRGRPWCRPLTCRRVVIMASCLAHTSDFSPTTFPLAAPEDESVSRSLHRLPVAPRSVAWSWPPPQTRDALVQLIGRT